MGGPEPLRRGRRTRPTATEPRLTPAETDGTTPADGDGESGSGLFASRPEAIQSVGAFANSGAVTPVEPYSGPSADLIRSGSG